jgi:hypothetical protein
VFCDEERDEKVKTWFVKDEGAEFLLPFAKLMRVGEKKKVAHL